MVDCSDGKFSCLVREYRQSCLRWREFGQTLPPAKVLACKKGVVARPYGRREDARLVADTQRYGCEALGRRLDLAAR
jgi:hypothetical protein